MEKGGNFRLVFVTIDTQDNAIALARILVGERLAACCTLLAGATSVYCWQDRTEESREVQLLIKTSAEKLEAIEKRICGIHAYEIPEIISIAMREASSPYMAWMNSALSK